MARKNTHVIEEYSVSRNSIECVCGWIGDADTEWLDHRKEMKDIPVDRPIETHAKS